MQYVLLSNYRRGIVLAVKDDPVLDNIVSVCVILSTADVANYTKYKRWKLNNSMLESKHDNFISTCISVGTIYQCLEHIMGQFVITGRRIYV